MKACVQVKTKVAEFYREVTQKHPHAWINKTSRYVSVKLLDRHLSDDEMDRFNVLLRKEFKSEFLLAQNAYARVPINGSSTANTVADGRDMARGYIMTPKVTVRFASSYPVPARKALLNI
jgi:hypothetical protein